MLGFGHDLAEIKSIVSQPTCAIVFYHIHKTAGTTLENAIIGEGKLENVRSHTPQERANVLAQMGRGEFEGKRIFIYGHETFGITNALAEHGYVPRKNLFRFTFLRNPKSRLESMYNFLKLRRESFSEPFEKFMKKYQENLFCNFLKVESPTEWLKDQIEFVGIQEDFETSISVLFQLLGLQAQKQIDAYLINANKQSLLDPVYFQEFYERQKLDYLLYEIARAALLYVERDFGEARLTVKTGDKSFVRKTALNFDLQKNNDHISLMETGYKLFEENPEEAANFFLKSVTLNMNNARHIRAFLLKRDEMFWEKLERRMMNRFQDHTNAELKRVLGH